MKEREKMAKILNTPEQAKELAQEVAQTSIDTAEKRKVNLANALNELNNYSADFGGFDGIGLLLALPDEEFNILAPVFLNELAKSLNNVNDQVAMAQALNVAGIRAEDVQKEFISICEQIDKEMEQQLTAPKRDFLKQIVGLTYNAVSAAEGVSKRYIVIPIEYCREDAKMPTYAHLTDAGMDIYLTEDVTIHPGETKLIPTGIKVAIPLGYELQVRPKSGRSLKSKLRIANAPGTIDAGYRDEIGIICDNIDPVIRSADMDDEGRLTNILWGSDITLSKGEKIAQLVLNEIPKAVFYEVESVAAIENDGRKGGFGSTGDK
jgi:dUTP pyrophosphatase